MADQREPDLSEDPRDQDASDVGYPESGPEEAAPDVDEDTDRSGGDRSGDAPSPSTAKEADRGHSTGNPDAAG